MGLDSFLKVFLSQYLKKNIQVNQFFFHIRSLSVKQCSFVLFKQKVEFENSNCNFFPTGIYLESFFFKIRFNII